MAQFRESDLQGVTGWYKLVLRPEPDRYEVLETDTEFRGGNKSCFLNLEADIVLLRTLKRTQIFLAALSAQQRRSATCASDSAMRLLHQPKHYFCIQVPLKRLSEISETSERGWYQFNNISQALIKTALSEFQWWRQGRIDALITAIIHLYIYNQPCTWGRTSRCDYP